MINIKKFVSIRKKTRSITNGIISGHMYTGHPQ